MYTVLQSSHSLLLIVSITHFCPRFDLRISVQGCGGGRHSWNAGMQKNPDTVFSSLSSLFGFKKDTGHLFSLWALPTGQPLASGQQPRDATEWKPLCTARAGCRLWRVERETRTGKEAVSKRKDGKSPHSPLWLLGALSSVTISQSNLPLQQRCEEKERKSHTVHLGIFEDGLG